MLRRKHHVAVAFRSDIRFIAAVAGMGLLTDVCLFPLFTPAIPFRLEQLGYTSIPSLTGWLTAAYAGGLIIATFPFAWLGSKYRAKRNILIGALALMAVGILLFLLVPNYAAMVIARVMQGASGAGIWTLGLALVADNCDPARLGRMMGVTMVGYSIGNSIGQPIGGVLYGQLGWKAPSIFALILIVLDLVLRLLVLEKHEVEALSSSEEKPSTPAASNSTALQKPVYAIKAGEDTNTTEGKRHSSTIALEEPQQVDIVAEKAEPQDAPAKEVIADELASQPSYNHWHAITYLLFHMRPLTPLLISFVNGFIISGVYNTALVLRLNDRYGLDSTKAGLVYFAVAIPSAVMSPLAGRLTDWSGPRPLSIVCCACYAPVLALLMIDQLPLAAFITLLAFAGLCAGLINSPVMVFLAIVAAESNGRIGTSHAYGGFNLSFSVACFIGPIVAGQVLERLGVSTGFKVQLGITAIISLGCVPLAWRYMRTKPRAESQAADPESPGNELPRTAQT